MVSSVELPLSIIVGCLPTLRPLFNRSKTDRTRPWNKQEDTYVLTDPQSNHKIRKTTSIEMDISGDSGVSSSNLHAMPYKNAWDMESRA